MFPRLPFSLQNAHAALSLDVPAVGASPAAPAAAGGGCATNALPDGEPRRRRRAPLPQRPLRHGSCGGRGPPVQELLRRARDADGVDPVVHRDDRLRRHLLLHRRDGARGAQGQRQGAPHRLPPHDRRVQHNPLILHLRNIHWNDQGYSTTKSY